PLPAAGWEALTVRPAYQPIVRVADGARMGYEALARPQWGGRAVDPATVFALAERADAVVPVDLACLEAVVTDLERRGGWPAGSRLFLNVRLATVRAAGDRLQALQRRLEDVLGGPAWVWEVSEADRFTSAAEWPTLHRLCPPAHWAVDDWGSGWHDLSRLVDLQPQWLKFDRNWLEVVQLRPAARRLWADLVRWATDQGCQVVAEGVETIAERDLVQAVGIPWAQGYFWARPGFQVPGLPDLPPAVGPASDRVAF
ncbi:MAG: EAL domain-containing protein, partial [Firmicutes bacterium]|nr:EAL domain-containing protein [Bacillota bacterium]